MEDGESYSESMVVVHKLETGILTRSTPLNNTTTGQEATAMTATVGTAGETEDARGLLPGPLLRL